jgi:hypothetical protein
MQIASPENRATPWYQQRQVLAGEPCRARDEFSRREFRVLTSNASLFVTAHLPMLAPREELQINQFLERMNSRCVN